MQRYAFTFKPPNFWRNIFYYLKTLLTFIVDFSDVHNYKIKIIIIRIMCINPFDIIAFNISIVVIFFCVVMLGLTNVNILYYSFSTLYQMCNLRYNHIRVCDFFP